MMGFDATALIGALAVTVIVVTVVSVVMLEMPVMRYRQSLMREGMFFPARDLVLETAAERAGDCAQAHHAWNCHQAAKQIFVVAWLGFVVLGVVSLMAGVA